MMNEKTEENAVGSEVARNANRLESDIFTCPKCGSHMSLTSENWHLCQRCKHEWYTGKAPHWEPKTWADLGGKIE